MKAGIPVIVERPGVGENLQDHLQLRCAYKVAGVRTLNEMIGRTDLLVADDAVDHWKARGIDLGQLLAFPELPDGTPRLSPEGRPEGRMIGSVAVTRHADHASAQRFWAADPYVADGVWRQQHASAWMMTSPLLTRRIRRM